MTIMMRRVVRRVLLVGLLTATAVVTCGGLGHAQDRWGAGTDIGFWSGTVDGTVFALGANLDYYVDRAFSVGPMLLLAPAGDLTQIAVAGAARYHFQVDDVNIVPLVGIGFVHADLDRGSGAGRIERSDTSHFIPLGMTVEYQANSKLALAGTVMVNLHDLNLNPPVPRDRTSVAVMFGVRFGP